jgi:BirA family transcriptional regulator, biotin operon repressor / biotin---[acetyl-CoA-carboxylase] ligase
MNFTILTYDTIDSTNTEAIKQARNGAGEGVCVVAREQTAGRGRHGRTWISEKDAGLYFSVILRPNFDHSHLPLITLMAGVSVHDALAELGLTPDIKWVNDILIGDKKIAGILAETTETTNGLAVIVGIGINLRSSNFPGSATSIEEAAGRSFSDSEITSRLTANLDCFYTLLSADNGHVAIIQQWCRRSTYTSGKRVRVTTGNNIVTGVTDGLDGTGALRIRQDTDAVVVIQAGEVERLRAEN